MKELLPISKDYIAELTSIINMNACDPIEKEYIHKLNDNYSLISGIERIPNQFVTNYKEDNNKIYYYSVALPNYQCPFCFDHELDHIPFMMLLEFLRQMAISTSHKLYNVPLHGFTNIMDGITDFKIYKFIELDVPLILICEDTLLKQKKSLLERVLTMHLYQNNEVCSQLKSNISVMTKGIYSRIRKNSRMSIIKNSGLSEEPTTNLEMLETADNIQNRVNF